MRVHSHVLQISPRAPPRIQPRCKQIAPPKLAHKYIQREKPGDPRIFLVHQVLRAKSASSEALTHGYIRTVQNSDPSAMYLNKMNVYDAGVILG